MTEVIASLTSAARYSLQEESAESRRADASLGNIDSDWVSNAASAALDHFRNNPMQAGVETAAALGVAAIAVRCGSLTTGKAIESIAQISEAPVVRSAVQAVVNSPSVLRNKYVLEDGAIAQLAASKPTLSYKDISMPLMTSDQVSIPTFVLVRAAGKEAAFPLFRPAAKNSPLSRLYENASQSTVQILRGGRASTGFFVDDTGLLVTANHAVPDLSLPLKVRLASGEALPARLVASDQRADLALLRIDKLSDRPDPLQLLTHASDAQPGKVAFMVGHPGALRQKVLTQGEILDLDLAYNRNPAWTFARLRHDIPSLPGNSGSPVLLENGLVAGIHSARGAEKLGLATSVAHLDQMLNQISKPGIGGFKRVNTDAYSHFSYQTL